MSTFEYLLHKCEGIREPNIELREAIRELGIREAVEMISGFRLRSLRYAGLREALANHIIDRCVSSASELKDFVRAMQYSGLYQITVDYLNPRGSTAVEVALLVAQSDCLMALGRNVEAQAILLQSVALCHSQELLARCALSMGLASWDWEEDGARRLLAIASQNFKIAGEIEIASLIKLKLNRHKAVNLQDVRIVIYTHASTRFKDPQLYAPGTDALERLLISINKNLLRGSSLSISVFLDGTGRDIDKCYEQNVRRLIEAYDCALIVNHHKGLIGQWQDAFSKVGGEIVINIEHDHEILPSCPPVSSLLDLFNQKSDVQYIRLNRRENLPDGYDVAFDSGRKGLLLTNMFSNTPHIMRRFFYESLIHPLLIKDAFEDALESGAGGIEENVNLYLARHVEPKVSPPVISRLLGMSIWGELGEGPIVKNLGY